MNIILIRHAQALNRVDWNDVGRPDRLRPLTKKGAQRFALAVHGLTKIIEMPTRVYSSEYVRCVQTAEIVRNQFDIPLETNPILNADQSTKKAFRWVLESIEEAKESETLMVVGHEPQLSELASLLLTGEEIEGPFGLKKGQMMNLEKRNISENIELKWSIPPKILGKIH